MCTWDVGMGMWACARAYGHAVHRVYMLQVGGLGAYACVYAAYGHVYMLHMGMCIYCRSAHMHMGIYMLQVGGLGARGAPHAHMHMHMHMHVPICTCPYAHAHFQVGGLGARGAPQLRGEAPGSPRASPQ